MGTGTYYSEELVLERNRSALRKLGTGYVSLCRRGGAEGGSRERSREEGQVVCVGRGLITGKV